MSRSWILPAVGTTSEQQHLMQWRQGHIRAWYSLAPFNRRRLVLLDFTYLERLRNQGSAGNVQRIPILPLLVRRLQIASAMRGTPALMVPRVWCVGRARTRWRWGVLNVQHALQAMLWRVVLRRVIANVMQAQRVSSLRRGAHVRIAKQARTVLLLDPPLVKRVQQANTTRRQLPLRANCVRRILCLLLVLIN
jgi:hypothetical protein